jgi:hypothetical protein
MEVEGRSGLDVLVGDQGLAQSAILCVLGAPKRPDDEKRLLSYEGSNLNARTKVPEDDEKLPLLMTVQILMRAPSEPTTTRTMSHTTIKPRWAFNL